MNIKKPRCRSLLALLVASFCSIASTQALAGNLHVWNRTDHPITIGQFHAAGYSTILDYAVTLQPGDSQTFTYGSGVSGLLTLLTNSGQMTPFPSRLEYHGEANGSSSPNISYIDGHDLSMTIDDARGHKLGDLRSIVGSAPQDIVHYDESGRPGLIGWYDGSTPQMQEAGNYMTAALAPCPQVYIRPSDDYMPTCNPMTMAMDISTDYYVDFGNP